MSDPPLEQPRQPLQDRRPVITLGSRKLTLILVIAVLTPVMMAAMLSAILPKAHERPLAVEVDLIEDQGVPQALRVLSNEAGSLQSLRIELNASFAYLPKEILESGEVLELPLTWFAKKTGQHLNPTQTEIRDVVVTARISGNRRSVFEKEFHKQP